jgi:PAS domain S-box-containing protein
VLRANAGRVERIGPAEGLPHDFVKRVLVDDAGTLWIATAAGLGRLAGGRLDVFRQGSSALPHDAVMSLLRAPDGRVLVGTKGGVVEIRDGQPRALDAALGVPAAYANALLVDSRGALWIGTHGAGLIRVANGRAQTLDVESGAPLSIVNALLEDREGSIWVGTNGGGLFQLRQMRVTVVGESEGVPGGIALALREDRRGAMWIGTAGAGVVRFGPEGRRVFDVAAGLPHGVVLAIGEDAEGATWIGTPTGLARIVGDRVERPPPEQALAGLTVLAVHGDAQGRLWAGTNGQGLVRLQPPPVKVFDAGLPSNIVNTLADDGAGGLWIGTRGGVAHLVDEGLVPTGDGERAGDATALLLDPDGTLWVGVANRGLVRLRAGRAFAFTREHGLPDEYVHTILPDADGLWVSSNLGLARIARADLERVASGGDARLHPRLFGVPDGMRSREANGGIFPAGWRARDGRLWFPTIGGAVVVDPARALADTELPPARIEHVTVNQATVAHDAPIEVRAGGGNLHFHFSVPTFVLPELVTFQYRLDGYDTAWMTGGPAREVRYTNLPPGAYEFRVRAVGPDGVVSAAGDAVSVRLVPAFSQRTDVRLAALLAAGLALAAAGAGLQRRRVKRLAARQRELIALVDERTRAEQRYRDLFENNIDAVVVTDADRRIVEVNRRFAELAGRDAATLPGTRIDELLADADGGTQAWLKPTGLMEVELVRPDGRRVPLEVSTRTIQHGEHATGMQTVARDLSEQRELRDQLRQAQKMEAVGRLAGGIAHDFNNLLTVIMSFSGFLEEGLANGDASPDDVEEIRKAARRAIALTRQLLTFSRKQLVKPSVVDLNAVVRGVEPMLARLLTADIALSVGCDPRAPRCLADAGQLEIVLMNLVVNAADAMPDGGTLRITTRSGTGVAGPTAELHVADSGAGMTEDVRARVFEPFFTTKEPGKGTGLGLATVYGIVQQFGGTIQIDSAPGQGTEFRIAFPASVGAAGAAGAAASAPAAPRGGGHETVLVVEDEPQVRELVRRILDSAGYRVLAATDGEDALAQLAARRDVDVDLVLTDVVMPGVTGAALADRLRALRPGCEVAFMSGYATDDVLDRRLRDERRQLLWKPFTAESLLRFVREALDRRARRPA